MIDTLGSGTVRSRTMQDTLSRTARPTYRRASVSFTENDNRLIMELQALLAHKRKRSVTVTETIRYALEQLAQQHQIIVNS